MHLKISIWGCMDEYLYDTTIIIVIVLAIMVDGWMDGGKPQEDDNKWIDRAETTLLLVE